MAEELFDDLTDIYEAMIDWPKRLANEESFYRRWFEHAQVQRLVDVACGTGQHAAMFHSWGLSVEGSDLSPKMIERAHKCHGQSSGIRWCVRGFDQRIQSSQPYDAAICVGNSLALAPNRATAEQTIRQMMAAVRKDGIVLVHVLNLWRLPDGPCVWQKSVRTTISQRETLIVKGVHRCGGQGYVDLIVMPLDATSEMRSQSVPFLGLTAEQLRMMARRAGAKQVTFLGGYQDESYSDDESVDLIMVATR